MIYGEQDYGAIERHAYAAGNYPVADLAAKILDMEQEVKDAEEVAQADIEKAKEERDEAIQEARQLKQAMQEHLDRLSAALGRAQRVSNRDQIESVIADMQAEL